MNADCAEALDRTVLLARRELLPELTPAQVGSGLCRQRVRLRANEANVSCAAGQTAVVATAALIGHSGARLLLDLPDIALVAPQPPLRVERLAYGLLEWSHDLIMPAAIADDRPADMTVLFGDTPLDPRDAGIVLRLSGDAWSCRLEMGRQSVGTPWASVAPFGGLLGAVAVAAEGFRAAVAAMAERHGVTPRAEHPVEGPRPVNLEVPPLALPTTLDVGQVDFISAGAITNAALYALLRVPQLTGHLRLIDGDIGALNNLNRYLLLRRSTLGRPKVDVLSQLSSALLSTVPVAELLSDDNVSQLGPLAERVLVGVDDIPSRWLAQSNAPGWLSVGATSGLEAVVSAHEAGGPCAGCLHPHDAPFDGPLPTVAFVSAYAGFMQAYRLLANAVGLSPDGAVVSYPFALASPFAVMAIGQPARADCPVRCSAAQAIASKPAV